MPRPKHTDVETIGDASLVPPRIPFRRRPASFVPPPVDLRGARANNVKFL
jgi:hypothetical protein